MQERSRFTIGFDFDHTLGLDSKLERRAFLEIASEAAVGARRAFDADVAQRAIDEKIAMYRVGACGLDEALSAAYAVTFGNLAPPEGFAGRFRAAALALVASSVQPIKGAAALLERLLQEKIPHAILTNGWNPLQQRKAEAIGFRGPVLVSDELGVRKPSPEAFAFLCRELQTAPSSVWYVGDDPLIDIAGARESGLRAIWLDWEARHYPPGVPAPTATVHSLGEVLGVIV